MSRTVLVTGATGYIAKYIVLKLLDRGDTVIGTVRREGADAEMRAALEPALRDPSALTRYKSVTLDLLSDHGWSDAMIGVDAVIHTASPFPMTPPKDAEELIAPAVDGTLRVLRAAHQAGVLDVVVTSSIAAIMAPSERVDVYSETVWTDPDKAGLPAYIRSKTLAERAAWDFIEKEAPELRLSAINPGFVIGAPLDGSYGTSVSLIERLLKGKDPMIPNYGLATCHVEDAAEAHLRVLAVPEAIGHRHIICDRFLWLKDIADAVRKVAPGARVPSRIAPDFAVRFMGLFDASIRSISKDLGRSYEMDTTRMREVLGRSPRDAIDGVTETAEWLVSRVAGSAPPPKRVQQALPRRRQVSVAQ